jgi:hypothetical protein
MPSSPLAGSTWVSCRACGGGRSDGPHREADAGRPGQLPGALPRPCRTERNKTFRRKADAEKFLATVKSAKLRGSWTDPAAGRTTLAAWLEEWWGSAADLRPSTVARGEAYFNYLILPRFGETPLPRSGSPPTGVGGRAVVPGLQAGHRRQGLPAPRPDHDGGSQRRHAAPLALQGSTAAQGRAGGDAVPEPGRGRRPGRRDRLALPGAGPAWRLRRAAHRRAGRAAPAPGRPAARHRRCGRDRGRGPGRAVHGAAQDPGWPPHRDPAQVGGRGAGRAPRPVGEADGWVFTADKGGVLRPSNFRVKVWLPAVRAAGLAPLRPHDLRHTAVALWIAAGVNPIPGPSCPGRTARARDSRQAQPRCTQHDPSRGPEPARSFTGRARWCDYWRSSSRTFAAWAPFGPCVMSNSTAWPSASER